MRSFQVSPSASRVPPKSNRSARQEMPWAGALPARGPADMGSAITGSPFGNGARRWRSGRRRGPPPWPAAPPFRPRARGAPSGLLVPADELLEPGAGDLVRPLLRRGLHEVGGRGQERALDAAIHGDLARPDGVDDHAG